MDTPLTPLEFARRTRRLYADREAVVDGGLRLTYRAFFDRCDRWSSALQGLGTGRGDRIAYVAPNTHAQLESFYAVPQLGAVLVPVDHRLPAGDLAGLLAHCGARVVCAHRDQLDAIDSIRTEVPDVAHFVALEDAREGWLDYEELLATAEPRFSPPRLSEHDLLSINYTSGTTGRPRGVMITHRNAYVSVVGTLLHLRMRLDDRYLWTLPMSHSNGWAFVWAVTAMGAVHVCPRSEDPAAIFDLLRRERVGWLCGSPRVLATLAGAPDGVAVPTGIRAVVSGGAPDPAVVEHLEAALGWEVTQLYGLTETAPFIAISEPRPEHRRLPASERAAIKARRGVELLTSGELRVVDARGREVPADGSTAGEVVVRGNVVMKGYYDDPEATERAMGGGWFHTGDRAVVHPDGYVEVLDREARLTG